jgi:hypothetical protein
VQAGTNLVKEYTPDLKRPVGGDFACRPLRAAARLGRELGGFSRRSVRVISPGDDWVLLPQGSEER